MKKIALSHEITSHFEASANANSASFCQLSVFVLTAAVTLATALADKVFHSRMPILR